ncbi:hypothetical protein D3C76_1443360 [compost metagenome]
MINIRRILITGTIISIVTASFLGIISSWEIALKWTIGVGVLLWLLTGIFSGGFLSGDRYRANNSIETDEDKKLRQKYSTVLFFAGLPFLLTSLVIFLFIN